jgi:hypothetical protein
MLLNFFRNILNFIESRAILEMKSHSEESHEFVYLKKLTLLVWDKTLAKLGHVYLTPTTSR